MQAQMPLYFESRVKPIKSLNEALDADIWVITAGKPRKPGMSRADLIRENASIIRDIALKAKEASNAIFVLVTNPLDVMVSLFAKLSGIERSRILGMGGILDSARMAYFISEKTGVPAKDIEAWVLGAHSDTMVPCFSLTRISGKSSAEILSDGDMAWIENERVSGGAEIVGYLKTGSAFIAPAASAFLLVDSIIRDTRKLLPVSVVAQGEYGFTGAAIGLPVVVGREGIIEVREPELTSRELAKLRESFNEVMGLIEAV
jgi:malate dehydrogenase